MTISPLEKELEDQLAEAGNRLLSPPSSVDELLRLLDKVETFLAKVEQSPSKSMHNALCPSMDALVRDELLRHADLDVKVAVAACISEITRITAPEAPYNDDQMKEVFQLIVSSFEKLYDKSSRSYNKRTSILETVAKVRSCVVMLDLECDDLIVEMFKHFLRTIRDDHTEHVFSCMETIMSLVLEESEDVPTDLLSTILDCLKKDNKEVLPIAQKLGVRVLEKCSSKLKPYLLEAVKSEGGSFFDYSKVVADVCGGTFDAAQPSQADESKPIKPEIEGPLEEPITEDVPPADEVASAQAAFGSLKTVMSNGTLKKEKDEHITGEDSSKEPETENRTDGKAIEVSSNTKSDGADSALAAKSQTKAGKTNKRKGRKGISIKNLSEPSESAPMDVDKEPEKPLDHQEVESKDIEKFPCEDSTTQVAAAPTEKEEEKENADGVVPPKTPEDEAVDGEGQTKDASETKEDDNMNEEATKSVNTDSKNLPEENAVSDTKSHKCANIKVSSSTGIEGSTASTDVEPPKAAEDTTASESKVNELPVEKAASSADDKERTPLADLDSKKEPNSVSAYGIRTGKRTAKKRRLYGDEESSEGPEVSKKDDEVTSDTDRRTKQSAKKASGKKKKGQGRASARKNRGKTPAKEEGEKSASKSNVKESASKKTPKTDNKRKRGEEESPSKLKDEKLVGLRIRVLWQDDDEYYTGVISSFDAAGKTHKVDYDDGDVEILKLNEEKWELLNEETAVDRVDAESLDNSSDVHAKKSKTGSASSKKQGKASTSSKKSGGASSSKSKAAQPKSGSSKGKGDGSKGASKPQDGKEAKSKDRPKSAMRLKGNYPDSPKATGSKSKQETPKTVTKSKGKASKSGVKSEDKTNAAGSKVKSGGASSAAKDEKKTPEAAAKTSESTKGKSPPSSSKPQKSGSKTSKKRSRR